MSIMLALDFVDYEVFYAPLCAMRGSNDDDHFKV